MTQRYSLRYAGPVAVVLTLLVAVTAVTAAETDPAVKKALDKMVAEAKAEVEPITCEGLIELAETGAPFVLLDVRTEAEYQAGRLRGALWIPRGMLEFKAADGKVGKTDAQIVTYCRKTGRSALCAQALAKLGFTNVRYLDGGFEAWAKAGFPVYNRHGELKVQDFERPEME